MGARQKFTRELINGVSQGQRSALAKAITLIESSRADHRKEAQDVLNELIGRCGDRLGATFRLGIAGPPGAGKSTFIEKLGMRWIRSGHRVAVIPVDPSSHLTGGSILGDKTRMGTLTREPDAYIRGSPTRGVLGGIAEHTADVIRLCECAHYDRVIVESVGVGQSEVEIDAAVDLLLVIVSPAGGDGLQASKKGIMEAADVVVVNKADGPTLTAARHTKADYQAAACFIRPKHPDWQLRVMMMSAAEESGLDEVVSTIEEFRSSMLTCGALQAKRANQAMHWMQGQIRRAIVSRLENDALARCMIAQLQPGVRDGAVTPAHAAEKVIEAFTQSLAKSILENDVKTSEKNAASNGDMCDNENDSNTTCADGVGDGDGGAAREVR